MRSELLICLLLAGVTALIYGQVTGFDFVNFDDLNYVVENPHVNSGLTGQNIAWAFTTGYQANWHPLTWLSLMLDAQLWGLNATGFHLTNVLLHILNTLLLFWVLRAMTGATWPSALVAALFAWHPLHVESVAWVTERKDVLSLFWGLLSLGAYVLYCRRGTALWYVLAIVCLGLGLLAKAMLVTWPFLLLLLDTWPLGRLEGGPAAEQRPVRGRRERRRSGAGSSGFRSAPRTLGHLLLEKVPFLLLVVAASVATYLAQSRTGAVSDVAAVSFGNRLANAAVSYVRYLGKMIWPHDLSILYPHPNMPGGTPWTTFQVGGALLLLLAITGLVWRYRRHRFLTVGWLWYLGTLVPMVGIVQVGSQAMADRYTYLPLVGIFIAIVWSGRLLFDARSGKRASKPRTVRQHASRVQVLLGAGSVIVLLALAGGAWSQTRVWRDSLTLGQHAIAAGPTGAKIHYNLGLALSQRERYAEAIPHYREAIRLDPDHAKAYNNLGRTLLKLGRVQEAIANCQRAVQIDPGLTLGYVNLSEALVAAGRLEEAITAREAALRLDPDNAAGHNNLGGILASLGRIDEAIAHFRRALQLQPDFPAARENLQMALKLQEDTAVQTHP